MIEHTKEEVLEFLQRTFDEADDFSAEKSSGGWNLEVSRMYEYVEFSAEKMFSICRFFNTMNVNDDRYAYGGCETCDYGSKYTVEFTVRDGKPFPQVVGA